MRNFLFIILLFLLAGCEKIYFKDDPSNTPENNFELFWKDFDMYYSQFSIRNMNWDSVYATVKPQSATMNEVQLFNILSGVVVKLNDMHVNLYTDHGSVSWKGWGRGKYPSGKLINPFNYLKSGSPQNSTVFEYREFKNHNIGYIIIHTFSGTINGGANPADDRYLFIDTILDQFKDKDGIVIDVRWNGGGNSWNAETVASRFADEKRIAGRHRSKNGPGKNDFSDWLNWYIEPKGNYQYTKPVVVLTSRKTSSSAEDYIMYMQVLPNVTIVGDTTGGGTGSPVFRELPNGWTYKLSTSYAETADNKLVDGKGIVPDITVQTSVADSIAGVDRIIEKGLELLKK
jgi:carboxyl-terminal processing protease